MRLTIHICELLRELLLFLIELTGIIAKLVYRIGELPGGFPAELITKLVELLAGACPGSGCIRDTLLIQRFGCLPHLLTRLFQLLHGVSHPFLIFRLIHAISKLIGIAKLLLLLIAEPCKLPFELFALLLLPSLLQSGLNLAHLAVEILLALRQFSQAIEHLSRLPLGRILVLLLLLLRRLSIRLPLRLIAILFLFEIKIVQLALPPLLRAGLLLLLLLALLAILTGHFKLAGAKLEKLLVCRLLGSQCLCQRLL